MIAKGLYHFIENLGKAQQQSVLRCILFEQSFSISGRCHPIKPGLILKSLLSIICAGVMQAFLFLITKWHL